MKKLLAAVITLMMLISCVIIAAFPTSAVEINYDDFDIYEREDDAVVGSATYKAGLWIAEYLGDDKEVIVPSIDPDGVSIVGLDTHAFVNNKTVETVYVCEGLQQFADEVFKNAAMLQHISLPYSLTTLGTCNVFQYTSITSMVIPGKVEEIPCCLVQGAGKDRGGLDKALLTDLVISYGVKKIKQGALLYDGSAPLIFPSTMTDIRGAFDIYRHTSLDVYILNPKCVVGEVLKDFSEYKPNTDNNDPSYPFKYKKGDNIPPVLIWANGTNGDATIKIHGPKNSNLKQQVKDWKAKYGGNFEFIEMTDAEVKEKDQWTKDNGIIKSTGWEMSADEPGVVYTPGEKKEEADDDDDDADDVDEDDETTSGSTKKKKDKKKNGDGAEDEDEEETNTSGGFELDLTWVFVILGVFVALIAAAIVIAIVISKNKKKKKQAKKKAAAEAAEAEPVIEAENLEETPAEPTDEQ